jgi:hypothetical protein
VTLFKKSLFAAMCLQLSLPVYAGAPPASKPEGSKPASAVAPLSDAERYARRCQAQSAQRYFKPQGTMLWGTRRSWDTEKGAEERSSVLVSAELTSLRQAKEGVKALRTEEGHLVAVPASPQAMDPAALGVVGTVLQGTASDGKPVEVAICGAEPSPEDPDMVWYRIEAWNAVAQEWENPCVALDTVPDPRALAVRGAWDASGGRQDLPGKVTFACENGAISKCARWGYKPWETRDGHSLADLHQACTRMARADYCGNGRSHTHQDTIIDMYDQLGVLSRTTEASEGWDPARASFEAAWGPDGATCLSRTRDGRALETILQECPNRFSTGAVVELGEGDRCTAQRPGMSPKTALLRNQSYGTRPAAAAPAADKP